MTPLVRVEFKKEKRRITALRFFIKPQKNNPALFLAPAAEKTKDMDLHQRLITYFHLTSTQAQEVLVTHQKEDILENLKYVEKKIKEGTVNSIGAYTITAIKENYRILPNLFAQEESGNQNVKQKEEKRQQVLSRLKQQYEDERDRQFEKLEKEHSTDTLNKMKKQAKRKIEQRQGENFPFLKLLSVLAF